MVEDNPKTLDESLKRGNERYARNARAFRWQLVWGVAVFFAAMFGATIYFEALNVDAACMVIMDEINWDSPRSGRFSNSHLCNVGLPALLVTICLFACVILQEIVYRIIEAVRARASQR